MKISPIKNMSINEPLKPLTKIRVLIVDDSSVMRRIIMSALLKDPEIEVVGTSADGIEAIADIKRIKPDLVTLDIEMPKMDGISALKEIRTFDHKLPIVMFSSLTQRGADATIEALTCGASDYVGKPANVSDVNEAYKILEDTLIPKIKALCAKVAMGAATKIKSERTENAAPSATRIASAARSPRGVEALCIGVSTGGPAALMYLFETWKAPLSVPIFIVQHMPPEFPALLAKRLTNIGVMPIAEPTDGQEALPGHAYIAPGGMHMAVARSGSKVTLSLNDAPPENSCRPAVDVLFRSAAQVYGGGLLALVLTGMGSDGLKGATAISQAGGQILAQDEESSVVWGMPGAVVGAGLANQVLPLDKIPDEILLRLQKK